MKIGNVEYPEFTDLLALYNAGQISYPSEPIAQYILEVVSDKKYTYEIREVLVYMPELSHKRLSETYPETVLAMWLVSNGLQYTNLTFDLAMLKFGTKLVGTVLLSYLPNKAPLDDKCQIFNIMINLDTCEYLVEPARYIRFGDIYTKKIEEYKDFSDGIKNTLAGYKLFSTIDDPFNSTCAIVMSDSISVLIREGRVNWLPVSLIELNV